MIETRQMNVTTCDACGKQRVDSLSEGPAQGYHGAVSHHHESGGTGDVKFFACSPRCIGRAVQNALGRNEEVSVPAVDRQSDVISNPA